jgi:tRNA (guanine-N7-)-methyltransferase
MEEIPCVLVPGRLTPPLDWHAIFGRTGEVEIEIGCGKGLYLVEAARLRSGSDLVGVERAGKWFRRAVQRAHRCGLPNIRLLQADAFDFLARWVPPGSAAAIHVYFPDPWPKQRHGKRRLLQPILYRLAARALSTAGRLCLASDVEPYFQAAAAEVTAMGLFEPQPWPEDAPDRLPTDFAVKYAREGRPLFYARYARCAGMETIPLPVVVSPAGEEP